MIQPPATHDDHELEEHDRGLVYDLGTLDRRRVLKLLGFGGLSAGLFTLVGCGPDGATGSASAAVAATRRDRGQLCARARGDRRAVPGRRLQRPERPRRERRRAQRHPLELRLVDDRRRGRPAHDPADVQDARTTARRWPAPRSTSGTATATAATRCTRRRDGRELPARRAGGRRRRASSRSPSIFPACYQGRWPHIHFEVYPSLDAATDEREQDRDVADRAARRTPATTVYATDGYEQSVRTLDQVVARERQRLRRRRRGAPARHGDRQRGGWLHGCTDGGRRGLTPVPASGIVSVTPSDPATCPIIVTCRTEVHGAPQPP